MIQASENDNRRYGCCLISVQFDYMFRGTADKNENRQSGYQYDGQKWDRILFKHKPISALYCRSTYCALSNTSRYLRYTAAPRIALFQTSNI
jgi:hypothetical protein